MDTMTSSPAKRPGRRRNNRSIALGVALGAAIVWILCTSLWLQTLLAKDDTTSDMEEAVYQQSLAFITGIQPDDYEDLAFMRTLKSCIPGLTNNKCQMNVPVGSTTHRVGILSPPGELGEFFTQWLRDVVQVHSKEQTTDIVLLPTTHVPPYGYGKNHGWTKIIRLTTLPLSLASADALRISGDGTATPELSDLKGATRQLVRWHNRLSHVAAHTALLTITVADLLDDPWELEDKICAFLQITKVTEGKGIHIDEEELLESIEPVIARNNGLLTKIARTSGLLGSIEEIFEPIIHEEFKLTKNLTAWPCQSFWSVGGDPQQPTELSPLLRNLAKEMSPDCNAEYTKCTVHKDTCEQEGDPICK